MTALASRGKSLWDSLRLNINAFKTISAVGSTARALILNVHPQGAFVNGMSADQFFAEATDSLVASGVVYRWEDTICYEVQEPESQQLLTIATRQRAEPGAGPLLTNLFCVGVATEESMTESIPSSKLVNALLANREFWRRLPKIRFYAHRPVFDDKFNLCGPGWHAEKGILVHGAAIEPIMPATCSATAATALQRLLPNLRGLFKEFCWQSDADMTNALGMLLTGKLVNHLVDTPHPGFIVDGNQPGLGKTLLIQATGRILDGFEPPRIPLVKDEELEKKLCAQLRDNRSGIFFFDNARGHIESALLEASMLSPVLTFRLLGGNNIISRPNTYLWITTSNQTSGTSDYLRRNIPIRLFHEGDPKKRTFIGDPLEYAIEHRFEILGELAGMVLRWKLAGMPLGKQQHRCAHWAKLIGGVLEVNGFDRFLENLDEAEAAMDAGLQALGALAEFVIARSMADYFVMSGADDTSKGHASKLWADVFVAANVWEDNLANRSGKGKETLVGQFFSGKVDRTVDITVQNGSGTATLRARPVRSKQKVYWFEVAITTAENTDSPRFSIGADGKVLTGTGLAPPSPWMPWPVTTNDGAGPGASGPAGEDFGGQAVAASPATATGKGEIPAPSTMATAVPVVDAVGGQTTTSTTAPVAGGAAQLGQAGNDLQW